MQKGTHIFKERNAFKAQMYANVVKNAAVAALLALLNRDRKSRALSLEYVPIFTPQAFFAGAFSLSLSRSISAHMRFLQKVIYAICIYTNTVHAAAAPIIPSLEVYFERANGDFAQHRFPTRIIAACIKVDNMFFSRLFPISITFCFNK
jgi:hypothetical protein